MKIKQILPIVFIIPVLLSTAICFSQYDFDLVSPGQTQVVEEDGDSHPEFRQTISFQFVQVRQFYHDHSIFDISQLVVQSVHNIQFDLYNQKHLAVIPSGHRFNDLGAHRI